MLEETQQDHAIRSSVANTKLPLGRVILENNNNKKEKCDFLKIHQQQKGKMRFNIFSPDLLTFWLSYSTFSIITGSGTQQVNFMGKFCIKEVFDVDSFYISLMGTGWLTLNREC